MGCDGGTIPTRGELVRTKKKPEQVSKEVDLLVKWKHCAISQEPLQPPIVACELGRLYNKDAVIELLLNRSKSDASSKFDHLRGLKDVKELQLTANPAHTKEGESGKAGLHGKDYQTSPFICPITGLEMNGRYKFCYLLGCACVFSDRALKQLRDSSSACSTCGKAFTPEDVVAINGSEEEMEELRTRLEQRRQQAKLSRKSKRSRVETVTSIKAEPVTDGGDSEACSSHQSPSGLSTAVKVEPGSDGDSGASSSGHSTNEAVPDDVPPKKKSKLLAAADAKLVAGRSSASHPKLVAAAQTKDKKPASIQNDPRATPTYKSLFSSHSTAKNQTKAHWVTYNPFYN